MQSLRRHSKRVSILRAEGETLVLYRAQPAWALTLPRVVNGRLTAVPGKAFDVACTSTTTLAKPLSRLLVELLLFSP